MKKLLLRLLLGADDLVSLALEMISLRQRAIARYAANKSLETALASGKDELAALKTAYNWGRLEMEKAYTLELD